MAKKMMKNKEKTKYCHSTFFAADIETGLIDTKYMRVMCIYD